MTKVIEVGRFLKCEICWILDAGYWILDTRWFKKFNRFNKFKRLIEHFEQSLQSASPFGGLRGLHSGD